MSADAATPELVLRPSARSRRTVLIGMAAVFLTLSGIGAAAEWPVGGLVMAGFCAAVMLPILVIMLVFYRRGQVAVTPTEIVVVSMVKRQRFARAEAAQLVFAMLIAPRTPVFGNLFILDRHGERLARIYTKYYRDDELELLVERLGLPTSSPDRPVTGKQLAQWYPGIVWFGERRPFAFAMLFAGVTMALLVLIMAILTMMF